MGTVFRRIAVFLLAALIAGVSLLPAGAAGAPETGAAYYVDASGGNDEAAGTSPAGAWRTLARAFRHEFAPGERLLLKRGETFELLESVYTAGSGSAEAPVLLSAYGEGPDPVITARVPDCGPVIADVCHWQIERLALVGCRLTVAAREDRSVEDITVRDCSICDIPENGLFAQSPAVLIDCDESAACLRGLRLERLEIRSAKNGIIAEGRRFGAHRSGPYAEDVTLDGLYLHDIGDQAITLAFINNCTVKNSRIINCRYGVQTYGVNKETLPQFFRSPEEDYAENLLLEGLYIQNAVCDAVVLASVKNSTVRNCRILDCATTNEGAHAPAWTHHVDNVTFEYCEIAGSRNLQDGMAVDFDGWTTNSTYRYIYSHDNTRFMRNCVYDFITKNRGNSVYGCVSVNDNRALNHAASMLISKSAPSFSGMTDFSFHNNVIVNGAPIYWGGTAKREVYGNVFAGNPFTNVLQRILNMLFGVKGFSYTRDDAALREAVDAITARLPEPPEYLENNR